jgi:hypothetical protein
VNGTAVAEPVSGPVSEPENAWAGQGAVLLDIGGDVGALVVAMPEQTIGLEVEIRPLDGQHVHERGHGHEHGGGGAHEHLAHVAVVARPVGDGVLPSLVFPELEAGRYDLFEKGCPDAVALCVTVDGGSVTTVDWPA